MNTKCKTISRAYSGLNFDFCALHSQPKKQQIGNINIEGKIIILAVAADIFFSTIIDTFALPYTMPQQWKLGSIKLESAPAKYTH